MYGQARRYDTSFLMRALLRFFQACRLNAWLVVLNEVNDFFFCRWPAAFALPESPLSARRVSARFALQILRNKVEMQRRPGNGFRNKMRAGLRGIFAGRQRLRKCDPASVVDCEDLGERLIQSLNQRRRSAKVGGEMHRIEA